VSRRLALPKGVTIQCPAPFCGLLVAQTIRNIFEGEVIKAGQFRPLIEEVADGEEFKCPKCSTDYFLFGKFHTRELGWLPNYSKPI
jgi:hypothetical protein